MFIPELKEVHISSDAGRFIRPVLNLQTIKTNGDVMWNSFQNCLENGHVVYKDAYEIEQSQIAINLQDLSRYPTVYDSMEIHASCMLGVMACNKYHLRSIRNHHVLCYQSSMAKQAIGNIPSHHVKVIIQQEYGLCSKTISYNTDCRNESF